MRIIAGEFRSRRIGAPRGLATRPTSDRLRETLFNVLQPKLTGSRFLDLYAGSGANGMEALSRGAREAVFVERAEAALMALRANLSALGLQGRARVEAMPVLRWLGSAARSEERETFDTIFLDPPYAQEEEYAKALELMGGPAACLLAPGGQVVVEHRRNRESRAPRRAGSQNGVAEDGGPANFIQDAYGRLSRRRLLEQGDTGLSFFVMQGSA